ncbi:MAG: hypothetical protein NC123_15400 [Butyrivibrio sp.]|nr:hypothetical protein [Acetatifactor muris]MCM1560906.1 hypothetical protein [Butyrivibrio sp.]
MENVKIDIFSKFIRLPVNRCREEVSWAVNKRCVALTEEQYRRSIELVRILLQHSNVQITQRYLSISQKEVEDALAKTASHLSKGTNFDTK